MTGSMGIPKPKTPGQPTQLKKSYKIEFTIQTDATPHKVLVKRRVLLPSFDAIDEYKKTLLEDYNRQYPGGEKLQILDKFCGFAIGGAK